MLTSLIAIFISLTAQASSSPSKLDLAKWDSVGVFLRTDKVVVLINERGSQSRLQQFMNLVKAQNDFDYLSEDQGLKISCGRSETASTCTFRLLPSSEILIGPRSVETAFECGKLHLNPDDQFHMEFKNSNGDQFALEVTNGRVHLLATKTRQPQ